MKSIDYKINTVVTVKIKAFSPLKGMGLRIGSNWYEIGFVPVDYITDGVSLINRKYILSVNQNQDDLFIDKIIKLKMVNFHNDDLLSLDNTNQLFQQLSTYKLIQISLHSDSFCYIGKIIKLNSKSFIFMMLSTSAQWMDEHCINYDSVRLINLNNDYINSLALLLDL